VVILQEAQVATQGMEAQVLVVVQALLVAEAEAVARAEKMVSSQQQDSGEVVAV